MAQYRLSVNVIGRSSGRSSTAAAAYRAGQRIEDALTGEIHDYTRKQGVLHSEIITPDNTPEWMQDRSKLWNAVEAAERRRDAQLAREIQLSLPHELSAQQNANLLRRFCQAQFADRGMIADLAIHAPSSDPAADERNVHAHVMLTMREIVGAEGFGKKQRDWNDPDLLAEWREAWAEQQNRELERLGFAARVDHRSLEDQGVLREPQKHLGPIATEIERDGRRSYRGDENRAIQSRNALYADVEHAGNLVDAKITFEKRKFDAWADRKRDKLQIDQEERTKRFQAHLDERMQLFDDMLDAEFAQEKEGLSRRHEQVSNRLQVRGWRKFIRDITLTTRRDKKEVEAIEAEKRRVEAAEKGKRDAEQQNIDTMKGLRASEEMKKARLLEKGIEKARERRERDQWAMGPGKGVKAPLPSQKPPDDQNKTSPAPPARKPSSGAAEAREQRLGDTRNRPDDAKRTQSREEARKSRFKRPSPARPQAKQDRADAPDLNKLRQDAEKSLGRDRSQGLDDDPEQDL